MRPTTPFGIEPLYETNALRLGCADRPGLLRAGCPVVIVSGPWAVATWPGRVGIWLPNTNGTGPHQVAFCIEEEMGTGYGLAPIRDLGDMALDLSEVEGRNRAVAWLAAQHNADPTPYRRATGPRWRCSPVTGTWVLSWSPAEEIGFRASPWPNGHDPSFPLIVVPELATIDTQGLDRLLPDGSRWEDARALVLCCAGGVR